MFFVLLYVLIIAIFKTIVFFICAISVFFDNMLNKIKSNWGVKDIQKFSVVIFPDWCNRVLVRHLTVRQLHF